MTEHPQPSALRRHDYSAGEEIANAITHGIGVAASVVGLTLLMVFASLWGNAWHIVSTAVFGVTLILLYTASTLYHSLAHPNAKRIFKILDHSGIYLLIAGTYTPFTLVTLRGPWGWSLFGTVWGLALLGIAFEAFWLYRPKWSSALIYIGMGWIVVIAIKPLVASLPRGGLWLLFAGGLAYTGGTVFYVMKRVRYMHALWHLWVLAGSVCHFLSIILYVIPDRR